MLSRFSSFSLIALSFLLPLSAFAVATSGRIEFTVSPIRHELEAAPGVSKSESVKFINNSDVPYTLFLTIEDCVPDSNYGTPKCSASTSSAIDPLKFSTWINISGPTSFTVPPRSEQVVPFIINVPANASPGGYYGAIMFNNPSDSVSATGGTSVGLIRRIGVLVLFQVSGDIIIEPHFGDITIGNGSAGAGSATPGNTSLQQSLLSNPFGFFQNIFNAPPSLDTIKKTGITIANELDPFAVDSSETINPNKDFRVTFDIPMSNSGNTHIKPTGKIILTDEKGFQLTKIGKETIKSPEGAFIGERIVDYIPVNDEGGNVLPGSQRIFQSEWLGFPYETIGADGTVVIEYRSPEEYFASANNINNLYPWQRVRIVQRDRSIQAQIDISYVDQYGKTQTITKDSPVHVNYAEPVKGLHYGRILLLLFVLWVIISILSRRNRRLRELEALLEEDGRIALAKRRNTTKKPLEEEAPVVGTRAKKVAKKKVLAKEEEEKPAIKRRTRKPPTKE